MNESGGQAASVSGLGNDGVHFAVDANASVSRSLEWFLHKPVIPVPTLEHLDQGRLELLQEAVTDVGPIAEPDEVDQKVTGRL